MPRVAGPARSRAKLRIAQTRWQAWHLLSPEHNHTLRPRRPILAPQEEETVKNPREEPSSARIARRARRQMTHLASTDGAHADPHRCRDDRRSGDGASECRVQKRAFRTDNPQIFGDKALRPTGLVLIGRSPRSGHA
jgi:hypothetical protein